MSIFFSGLLSFLFPRRCPFCGHAVARGEACCPKCEPLLSRVGEKTCPRCGRELVYCRCRGERLYFDRCAAPFYYEGVVRRGIIRFKFSVRPSSAASFSGFAAEALARSYPCERFDFVTCVPLTRLEKRRRGFNQSELFARALARILSLRYLAALEKPRDVRPQRSLSGRERWGNVAGVFRARGDLRGKSVLLADDVVTTGATLSDCARALKAAGALRVCCVAIACVKAAALDAPAPEDKRAVLRRRSE